MTYPLSPTSDLARARDASSRVASPAWVVTNLVPLGRLSPAMTARARLAWAVRVWLSLAARFLE